jgi:hypothetical protein
MARRLARVPAAALAAGIALLPVAASAAPPPKLATAAIAGPWDERDTHLRFAIHAGPTPDQLVVTVPKDLQFPGSHDFVLTRTAPMTFRVNATDQRPGVQVAFKSPAEAELKLAGAGKTPKGAWMMANDYVLKRPEATRPSPTH